MIHTVEAMDQHHREPLCDQTKNFGIRFECIIESRCVNEDNRKAISWMVEPDSPNSRGERLQCMTDSFAILTSSQFDELVRAMEPSRITEKDGTYCTFPDSSGTHKTSMKDKVLRLEMRRTTYAIILSFVEMASGFVTGLLIAKALSV